MSIIKARIGTRKSQLARWQADYVANKLAECNVSSEIIPITSEGDQNGIIPLYEMGIQGIFTKTLDIALLNKEIDIAVHSLKDVPTQLPKGLTIIATPSRGNPQDTFVSKQTTNFDKELTIATSSLRRKAQWLNKYPHHTVVSVRGNINTRLDKLLNNKTWDGIIFASAGIERIQLDVPHKQSLDWMLPAPGQGALAIVCREDDLKTKEYAKQLNNLETMRTTNMERMFLRHLQGGCTMPIAAYAHQEAGKYFLDGNVYSLDGSQKVNVQYECNEADAHEAGEKAAQMILKNGAKQIIEEYIK